jgi:hypothetical protein
VPRWGNICCSGREWSNVSLGKYFNIKYQRLSSSSSVGSGVVWRLHIPDTRRNLADAFQGIHNNPSNLKSLYFSVSFVEEEGGKKSSAHLKSIHIHTMDLLQSHSFLHSMFCMYIGTSGFEIWPRGRKNDIGRT